MPGLSESVDHTITAAELVTAPAYFLLDMHDRHRQQGHETFPPFSRRRRLLVCRISLPVLSYGDE